MPSLSTYKISPPSDPQEFECLMRDFCDLYFQGHSVLYGRPGQKQYGVVNAWQVMKRNYHVLVRDLHLCLRMN